MSIQHTAQSVLHVLEDLYRIIDSSCQYQGHLNLHDSENLLRSLCTLSQLIHHIQQTRMCGETTLAMNDWHFQQNYRGYPLGNFFLDPMMGVGTTHPGGHTYGEYLMYQPIRVLSNGPYMSPFASERDFSREKRSKSKDRRQCGGSDGSRSKRMRRRQSNSPNRSGSRSSSTGSSGERCQENRSPSGSWRSEKHRLANHVVDQNLANRRNRSRQQNVRQRPSAKQQQKRPGRNRNHQISSYSPSKSRLGSLVDVPPTSPTQRSKIDRSSMTQS